MKIFQYSLLVNRNGVVVLTAKGILKNLMKNFTTVFVREVYVKQYVNTEQMQYCSSICLQYCICSHLQNCCLSFISLLSEGFNSL